MLLTELWSAVKMAAYATLLASSALASGKATLARGRKAHQSTPVFKSLTRCTQYHDSPFKIMMRVLEVCWNKVWRVAPCSTY